MAMHAPGYLSGVGKLADAGIAISNAPAVVSAKKPVFISPICPAYPTSHALEIKSIFPHAIFTILADQPRTGFVW